MNSTTKFRVVIVEDDPKHAASLTALLQASAFETEVVAVVSNAADAFRCIESTKPDLVFLDIELEGLDTGFDLLRRWKEIDFAVIFTTQFVSEGNILNAMRATAIDFLPKPVKADELENALRQFNKSVAVKQINNLRTNISSEDDAEKVIWIKSVDGKIRIETLHIIYCESSNSYTWFFLDQPVSGKDQYLSAVSIKEYEKMLEPFHIYRIHNEFLVNFRHVEKYKSKLNGGGTIVCKDGRELPVSRMRRARVRELRDLYRKK